MTIGTSIDIATLPTRRFGRTDMNITRVGFGAWAIGGGGLGRRLGRAGRHANRSPPSATPSSAASTGSTPPPSTASATRRRSCAQALAGIPAARAALRLHQVRAASGTSATAWHRRKRVGAPASIRRELEASLRRLGVERIDLYQMHWPAEDGTPLEEYWQTLLDLKAEGKVRAVGLSNHNVAQLEAAEALGHVDTLQPPFSAIRRDVAEAELPWCHAHETGVIVYSPMQSGLLTGRVYRRARQGLPAGRLALAQRRVPGREARPPT